MGKKKLDVLPPGNYTATIERVRKVRNKPMYKLHFTNLERIDDK
jgi:hypothetical protein